MGSGTGYVHRDPFDCEYSDSSCSFAFFWIDWTSQERLAIIPCISFELSSLLLVQACFLDALDVGRHVEDRFTIGDG